MTIEDRLRRSMMVACVAALVTAAGCSVSDEGTLDFDGDLSLQASNETADTSGNSDRSDGVQTAANDTSVGGETATPSTDIDVVDSPVSGDNDAQQSLAEIGTADDSFEEAEQSTAPALAVIEEKTSEAGSPFARLFSRDKADDDAGRKAASDAKPLIDMNGRGEIAGPEPEADDKSEAGAPVIEAAAGAVEGINPEADDAAAAFAEEATEAREAARQASTAGPLLPGVRDVRALYQIPVREGFDYTSYDDENGVIQVASAAGLAALAGSRLAVQHEKVDVACLKPRLVQQLRQIERHFGRNVLVTSGYRNRTYNRKVGGARESRHMYCEAADIQVPGVSKWQVAEYVRSLPGRGGVGTYCHTESIHVDIGAKRDWNWRCRRKK